ncbi:MAG: hypothetical protein J6V80_00885, partial [Clostridia bacterium]|nr:hypothetical protein [Clostridia bacterium]
MLEQESKLEFLVKKREAFLEEIKQEFDLDDEEYNNLETVEDEMLSGELLLEWFDHRDLTYINDMISCQRALLDTLKNAEEGDKKSLHNANKAFEELIHEARRIKKKRKED